jgi:hypothetical protein
MWKSKLKAAVAHAVVTLVVAVISAILVFWVWYPGIYSQLMPGAKLLTLILCVEVVLGPCMSLVIYNPQKSLRELIIDYSIVGLVQFSALVYGLHSVVETRPVFVVFVKDRFEVVSAAEIDAKDLQEAKPEFQHIPWTGPKFVCARMAANKEEKERILFREIPQGKDYQHLPYFYQECSNRFAYDGSKPIEQLKTIIEQRKLSLDMLNVSSSSKDVRWTSIIGKSDVMVVLVSPESSKPLAYLPIDPY